jgi:hypothetical protein
MNDSGGRGGTALRPSEEARAHDLVELERTNAVVG